MRVIRGRNPQEILPHAQSELMKGNQYLLGYRHTDETKAIISTKSKQQWTPEKRARRAELSRAMMNARWAKIKEESK